jgi:hypothetical protein
MTPPIRVLGIFASLCLVANGGPASAMTASDWPMAPRSVASPKPKPAQTPIVSGERSKDGVQVGGTAKVSGRLGQDRPPKKQTPPPTVPAASRETKDEAQPPAAPQRVEPRLNLGMCGPTAPDGTVLGPNRCQPVGPDEPVVPTPGVVRERVPRPVDVTWGQVLEESRSVVFPGLSVKVQPEGRTLVNLDTIVYTDESTVSTTQVSILGFPVAVEATPMSYVWSFGDGATVTTMTPGKPYPAKEITHRYHKRGGVSLTLTTNYAARFRIAGGPWQYVDGTVPITGPATPLLVREAVPVLVDPGR